jgi:hypothetical protein
MKIRNLPTGTACTFLLLLYVFAYGCVRKAQRDVRETDYFNARDMESCRWYFIMHHAMKIRRGVEVQ